MLKHGKLCRNPHPNSHNYENLDLRKSTSTSTLWIQNADMQIVATNLKTQSTQAWLGATIHP